MPTQPPRYRPSGWKPSERKPWVRAVDHEDKRRRGRPGQRDRAKVLASEPLCRACLKVGRTSASVIVDHITPLAWGGSDDRINKQGLCKPCHDEKSKVEAAEGRRRRARDQASRP